MSASAVHGEAWIPLRTVAVWYGVEGRVLVVLYEHGFLGEGLSSGASVAISVRRLDRVAEALRLHVHMGVDLALLALFLPADEAQAG
jgi:hypothetical protein